MSTTPDRLLQLGQGFMVGKVVLAAVELGLFDALADGPVDAAAIGARLGLQPRGLRDFLDALVAVQLLERDAAGRYANGAEAAEWLTSRSETCIAGFFAMMNRRLYPFWGRLEEALRSGRPQNEAAAGGDTFDALYADPAVMRGFLQSMTGLSIPSARAMAEKFPWDRVRTLVDVGAAQGGCPVVLAKAHPHLAVVGFDLPAVRPVFEEYVAAHGLADRVRFVPGDFFRDPFPPADAIVMGHILHDWSVDERRALVRKVHAALPPGGAFLAYDAMIDDDRRINLPGMLISLTMLLETAGGSDYTPREGLEWLREAGFRDLQVVPLAGIDTMIVGWK
jgi:SAM-dependent methyltransferase